MSTCTYNSDGPECQTCGLVITPDDPAYYDPHKYIADVCPACGDKFSVEVIQSVDWRCCPIDDETEAKP